MRRWKETRRRDREYDFWETVKKQRANRGRYEIPAANRNELMGIGEYAVAGRSGTGFESAGSGGAAVSKTQRLKELRSWRTT